MFSYKPAQELSVFVIKPDIWVEYALRTRVAAFLFGSGYCHDKLPLFVGSSDAISHGAAFDQSERP
jgi:hypothetical protein